MLPRLTAIAKEHKIIAALGSALGFLLMLNSVLEVVQKNMPDWLETPLKPAWLAWILLGVGIIIECFILMLLFPSKPKRVASAALVLFDDPLAQRMKREHFGSLGRIEAIQFNDQYSQKIVKTLKPLIGDAEAKALTYIPHNPNIEIEGEMEEWRRFEVIRLTLFIDRLFELYQSKSKGG